MEIADTLTFLLGAWELDRKIDDRRAGVHGLFQGNVILATAPDHPGGVVTRARYDENGEFRIGDHHGHASRRLDYERSTDATVLISFTNGQPFVELNLERGSWHAIHECGKDRYEITTIVRSPDELRETWCVRGPHKDYDAVSTLKRVGSKVGSRVGLGQVG